MTEQKFKTEEFRVEGEKLIAKVKELFHEGNIRRVIIKDKEGKTVMEIPGRQDRHGDPGDAGCRGVLARAAAGCHWSDRRPRHGSHRRSGKSRELSQTSRSGRERYGYLHRHLLCRPGH
jgi:hypothetical protein